jgi:microcystin-dependent protein
MARCSGCSGDRCSCVIRAGAGIKVSGAGTPRNPFVIEGEGGGGGGGWTPGDIKMAGYSAPEAGWLVANGQAVSRTAYAALFAKIGTTFGVGDGGNTFNLPDLAGRMPMGADTTFPLGSQGGAVSTVLTMAQVPQHTHTIAHTHDMSHAHSASSGAVNLDHGHHFVVGGGGHEHFYSANVNRQNYQAGGSFGATYAEATAGTAGGGGHTHEGDTWGVAGGLNHAHSVTVNTHSGSTGGSSAANSGTAGSAAPDAVPTLPPYVGVTFLIKT